MAKTLFFLAATNDATRRRQLYSFLTFKLAYIRHVPFERARTKGYRNY
jgi:hypothetical protein